MTNRIWYPACNFHLLFYGINCIETIGGLSGTTEGEEGRDRVSSVGFHFQKGTWKSQRSKVNWDTWTYVMCVILSHCNRWLGYDTGGTWGMTIRFWARQYPLLLPVQTPAMQLGAVINSPIQRVSSLRISLTIASDVSSLTCETSLEAVFGG